MNKRAITSTSLIVALIVGVAILLAVFLFLFPNIYQGGSDIKETRTNTSAVMSLVECQQKCVQAQVSTNKKEICVDTFSGDGPCVGVYGCKSCCEYFCKQCWCEDYNNMKCKEIMECTTLLQPHLYEPSFFSRCGSCQP